ncbi:hypothetical protein IX39_16025 [Chryseobacterium formosense]|uniref:DUF4280 domain-containing protein n=1 Tax=Chryseobacterium formosense TaxID=236814 RepID=A0A085Z3A0_9FLAO|nr:DUF4280 domain-containing protein [Chryseobacterium formosense]KFE98913.1 hypothetical protein IX39_16025 [Chryseobacterium formosense]SFT59057.1 protein of unknown function [Chryseobacterium formosense]
MKTYQTQPNDSFASIAKKFNIKDENFLQTFHNLNCSESEVVYDELPSGTFILIPEDPQFLCENSESDLEQDCMNDNYDFEEETQSDDKYQENDEKEIDNSANEKSEEVKESENSSSEHDGKYFVIQKGMVQCNQGFKFPKFNVTSHQKHYWNDADGQTDYLAVTEDDLQLDPPTQPFGQCKLKPSSGGYLPCTYAPAGKWTKTYDKVKVMGKCCVTELSELMCSTGGKITIFKHGQQSELGKRNVDNADSKEQQVYNPVVDFEEFKEKIKGNNEDAW